MKKSLKTTLLFAIAACCSINADCQAKKFPSPPSADAVKNPLKGNEASIADGKKVYARLCVTCHGDKGKGDGIAAPGLSKPPADHSSAFVQMQTDGALYWIISNGNLPMPAYQTTLTPTQRWQVINYIRTLDKKTKK